METTNTIIIEHPSKALVTFIEKAQLRKKKRMEQMRDKFLKNQG